MKVTPEAAFGRLPLKGATPVARQSRFHGVCLDGCVACKANWNLR
jgi:hypothetical protein